MAKKQLWDLVQTDPAVPAIYSMCDYVDDITEQIFPDDNRLAVYGRLAGRNLFFDELETSYTENAVVPADIDDYQHEDWLAGQITVGALNKQQHIQRTTW